MSLFDEQKKTQTPAPTKIQEKINTKTEPRKAPKETDDEEDVKGGADFIPHGVQNYAPQGKAEYVEGEKPDALLIKSDADMRDYLFSYPKVQVLIPLMPGEKPGSREPIIINGIRIDILKGAMVSVPEPFAKLVFEHYNVQAENGTVMADKRADSDKNKIEALS